MPVRRQTSRAVAACSVVSTGTPQAAASRTARHSSLPYSSSTASSPGHMARSSQRSPDALPQPSSTCVRAPTSSCGTPSTQAAISPRSSHRPTAVPSSERMRTISRSSVVLPLPGGPAISAPPPRSILTVSAPQPFTSCAMRRHRLPISRKTSPSRSQVTRPQSPMRCPPRSVKKPAPVLAGDMRSVRRLSACAAS